MDGIKEYLHAKSMLTPGAVGLLVVGITNTVSAQFAFGPPWPALLGLVLSLAIAVALLWGEAMHFMQKSIFSVLNGLVIFAVAFGGNGVVQEVQAQSPADVALSAFPSAQAQTAEQDERFGWCCINGIVNPTPYEECAQWEGTLFEDRVEAERMCVSEERREERQQGQEAPEESGFFRPWL